MALQNRGEMTFQHHTGDRSRASLETFSVNLFGRF